MAAYQGEDGKKRLGSPGLAPTRAGQAEAGPVIGRAAEAITGASARAIMARCVPDRGVAEKPVVSIRLNDRLTVALSLNCHRMDTLTLFGLLAVTAMLVFYALEDRSPAYVLAFAGACGLASAYGFLQGAWPFGVVEAIWAAVAVQRWRKRIGHA
jgi:hypothetical protein